MTSAESSPRIEKLNDKNYNAWKFLMKMVLIEKGLWEVIVGEQPKTDKDLRAWQERPMQVSLLT